MLARKPVDVALLNVGLTRPLPHNNQFPLCTKCPLNRRRVCIRTSPVRSDRKVLATCLSEPIPRTPPLSAYFKVPDLAGSRAHAEPPLFLGATLKHNVSPITEDAALVAIYQAMNLFRR